MASGCRLLRQPAPAACLSILTPAPLRVGTFRATLIKRGYDPLDDPPSTFEDRSCVIAER